MLCTACGKDQAQNYRCRTKEGEKTLLLCPACYRRLYGGKDAPAGAQECPSCGMTLAEFRKTGLLGCADCYTAFREELLPTVKNVQGKLRHTGKDPFRTLDDEKRELEAELTDARRTGDRLLEQRIRYRLSVIQRLLNGGGE